MPTSSAPERVIYHLGGGGGLSRDREVAYTVFPLFFGGNQARVGLLYHERDLVVSRPPWQALLRDIGSLLAVFTVIAILLWFYFYLVFFRRALLIVETIELLKQGDNTVRSKLDGRDELSLISIALDGMLDRKVVADKKVLEEAKLLKQLTEGLPVLIAYVDHEARYCYANHMFKDWFYLNPEDIEGQEVRGLLSEQGYCEIADHVHRALSGTEVEIEGSIPIANDGMRQFHATILPHLDNSGEVQGCFMLAQDITRQKTDQKQIFKAKEQWEKTFDSISDEIITIQDKEFRIMQANSAAAIIFGIPRERVIGSRCHELFRNEQIPCADCPAADMVLEDGKPHRTELYHDRLKKYFLVTMSPLLDEQAEFSGIIHTAKDISEFKLLEQQLRQAQKMEAIGTLAGGIAHDFNNILTPIIGFSEIVVEQLPSSSDELEMVEHIRVAANRAKELVKQILTFSRETEQQRQPLQIHLIIKEALKMLRASIPTTIAIHQEVADCGLVLADPTQVHQVLMNLCTNAYHAMRETGGELSVSLAVVEIGAQDYLDNLELTPGPHVKLSVRDTGCGMSKEIQERIFEPYFTTKKQGEGTGLGLSVVHGIVQSNHGHITVYSEPGKGCEFHVYLPQVKALAEGHTAVVETTIPSGSGTILVVDDEPPVGMLLKRVLLSLGYEVELCASSTEALDTFQQNTARFDLVLTDMAMPVMNGAELTRLIKLLRPTIPVVLCTGFSEIMDEERAKRMGIDGFLLKPVIKRQLAQAIHEALLKKEAINHM